MFLEEIPQKIDALVLSEVIPHSGPMVLLDWIEEWDDNHIICSSNSHQRPNNPLEIDGELSAIHAIEYAAQAASFHAALLSIKYKKALEGIGQFGPVAIAFLAVVRDFHFADVNLRDFKDTFMIYANEPQNGPRLLQYKIHAEIGKKTVAHGQITLIVEG